MRGVWRWIIGESAGPPRHPFILGGAALAVAATVLLLVALLPASNSTAPPVPPASRRPAQATTTQPEARATPGSGVNASPQVFTPPTTIADNCSTDVGNALRSWLWDLPRGTPTRPLVVDFPKNSCYLVNEALYLRGMTSTTFDGNGAEFLQIDPTVQAIGPLPTTQPYCGAHVDNQSGTSPSTIPIIWWFEGGCDITITDMEIVGPDTTGVVGSQNDSGIQLSGVQRALIDQDTVRNVDGDFITLTGLHEGSEQAGGGMSSYPSTNITIRGNTFSRSGRQGITPQYVDGVTITGNSFRGVAATEIDLEADTVGGCACNVDVDHNTFAGLDPYLVAGLTGLSIEHFSFIDNELTDGAQMKIQLAPELPSSDIVISGNSGNAGSTWPWPTIGIAYSVQGDSSAAVTDVRVSGNSIPAPATGRPFVRAGSQAANVVVSTNVISGPTGTTPLLDDGRGSNRSCGNTAGPYGPGLDGVC